MAIPPRLVNIKVRLAGAVHALRQAPLDLRRELGCLVGIGPGKQDADLLLADPPDYRPSRRLLHGPDWDIQEVEDARRVEQQCRRSPAA